MGPLLTDKENLGCCGGFIADRRLLIDWIKLLIQKTLKICHLSSLASVYSSEKSNEQIKSVSNDKMSSAQFKMFGAHMSGII